MEWIPDEVSQTEKAKARFLEKFRETLGNISLSARACNISRSNYYYWRQHDEEFAREADECIEGVGDFVESKLLKQINDDNVIGMIFYCKTKLKNRGYVEREEITGKDGAALIPEREKLGNELALLDKKLD